MSSLITKSDKEGRYRVGNRLYRFFEIIPGTLVWATLLLALFFAFAVPPVAIIFVILFDLYWVIRVAYFVFLIFGAWRKFRYALAVDWLKKMGELPASQDIWHVIFLPTYKEDLAVIQKTFSHLVSSAYPHIRERFIVVLAGEEADKERFEKNAKAIRSEFGDLFFKLVTTIHPKNQEGEIPGKGSNLHYAGHEVKKIIDEQGIPYDNIIVSAFDIDTCVHPQYFAHLTFTYLTHPSPTRVSYQPVALYNNNVWQTPAAVRVAAFGTTFWLMSELMRPEKLFTFSSHSMSFRALSDVGFWQKDIVTEDSRIFLQCLLHYNGDYSVVPMYVPVSMDMVGDGRFISSLRALYVQQRRWAWGVEHIPYLLSRFWKNQKFPTSKKIFLLWNMMEGMYTWATAPIIIFILGYLPFFIAGEHFRTAVLFLNTPHLLEFLMRIAMIGVFVAAAMSFTMLPPAPHGFSGKRHWLIMVLQWALAPITFVLFGAIPAIDAQTRLLFGKYLGFTVTKKRV